MLSCMPSYSIPKKKVAKLVVKKLQPGSREYSQLKRDFHNHVYALGAASKAYSVNKLYEIYNPSIEAQYNRLRKDWKEKGYNDDMTTDTLGFLEVESYSIVQVANILKNGIEIGNLKESALCDPALGVQLSRHSDITSENILRESQRTLLVFKLMKGKVKTVDEQMEHLSEMKREPQLGFDTLTSQLIKSPNMFLSRMYYSYQFADESLETPCQIPPQICPIGFITFQHTLTQLSPSSVSNFNVDELLIYLETGALPKTIDSHVDVSQQQLPTQRKVSSYSAGSRHKLTQPATSSYAVGGEFMESSETDITDSNVEKSEELYEPAEPVKFRPTFMSLDKESAKWKEFSEVLASNILKDKDYFTITEMYYISSHKLQEKYDAVKDRWKYEGYSKGELLDKHAYLDVTNYSVKQLGEICSYGLQLGNMEESVLADPNLGVQLSLHPDKLTDYKKMAYEKVLLVFSYMAGRQGMLLETINEDNLRPPDPQFDSFVSEKIQLHSSGLLSSLVYIHSYCKQSQRNITPAQIFPLAFLRIRFRKSLRYKVAAVTGPNIQLLQQCMKSQTPKIKTKQCSMPIYKPGHSANRKTAANLPINSESVAIFAPSVLKKDRQLTSSSHNNMPGLLILPGQGVQLNPEDLPGDQLQKSVPPVFYTQHKALASKPEQCATSSQSVRPSLENNSSEPTSKLPVSDLKLKNLKNFLQRAIAPNSFKPVPNESQTLSTAKEINEYTVNQNSNSSTINKVMSTEVFGKFDLDSDDSESLVVPNLSYRKRAVISSDSLTESESELKTKVPRRRSTQIIESEESESEDFNLKQKKSRKVPIYRRTPAMMQTIHYISDKSAKMMFGQQGPVIEESFCEESHTTGKTKSFQCIHPLLPDCSIFLKPLHRVAKPQDGKLTPKSMTFKKINTNELWNPDAVLADKEHLMTLLPARDVSKATETTGPEHQASVVKETKAADEQVLLVKHPTKVYGHKDSSKVKKKRKVMTHEDRSSMKSCLTQMDPKSTYEEIDIFASVRGYEKLQPQKRKRKLISVTSTKSSDELKKPTPHGAKKVVRFNLDLNTKHIWEVSNEESILKKHATQENVKAEASPLKCSQATIPGSLATEIQNAATPNRATNLEPYFDPSKGFFCLPSLPLFKENLVHKNEPNSETAIRKEDMEDKVPMPEALLRPPSPLESVQKVLSLQNSATIDNISENVRLVDFCKSPTQYTSTEMVSSFALTNADPSKSPSSTSSESILNADPRKSPINDQTAHLTSTPSKHNIQLLPVQAKQTQHLLLDKISAVTEEPKDPLTQNSQDKPRNQTVLIPEVSDSSCSSALVEATVLVENPTVFASKNEAPPNLDDHNQTDMELETPPSSPKPISLSSANITVNDSPDSPRLQIDLDPSKRMLEYSHSTHQSHVKSLSHPDSPRLNVCGPNTVVNETENTSFQRETSFLEAKISPNPTSTTLKGLSIQNLKKSVQKINFSMLPQSLVNLSNRNHSACKSSIPALIPPIYEAKSALDQSYTTGSVSDQSVKEEVTAKSNTSFNEIKSNSNTQQLGLLQAKDSLGSSENPIGNTISSFQNLHTLKSPQSALNALNMIAQKSILPSSLVLPSMASSKVIDAGHEMNPGSQASPTVMQSLKIQKDSTIELKMDQPRNTSICSSLDLSKLKGRKLPRSLVMNHYKLETDANSWVEVPRKRQKTSDNSRLFGSAESIASVPDTFGYFDSFLDDDEEKTHAKSTDVFQLTKRTIVAVDAMASISITFYPDYSVLKEKKKWITWKTCPLPHPLESSSCYCIADSLFLDQRTGNRKEQICDKDIDAITLTRLALTDKISDCQTQAEHIVDLTPCQPLYNHISHQLVDKYNEILADPSEEIGADLNASKFRLKVQAVCNNKPFNINSSQLNTMASQSGHNKLASTNGIKQADSQELLKNNLELISDHCGTNNSAQHEESEKSWMAHGQQNSSGLYSGTTENFDPQQASVIQPPPSIGSVHTTDYNVLPEDTKKTTDQNTCSVEKSSVMRDTVRPNLDRMEGDVQLSNVCRPSDNNQITNSFSDIEEKSVQFLNFGQHSSEADSTKCCLAKTTSSNVHQISISKSTINTSDHIENKNSDPSTVVNKANSFIDSAECKSVTELCTKLGNKLSCVTNTGCDGAPDICKSESEIVDESLSCLVTNSENEPKTLVENIDCLETIENDAQHLSVTKYVSKHENTSECNGNIIFNKPQGDLRLHDFTERNTNSCHIEEKDIFQRKSLSSIDECSTKSSNKFSEGNINSAPKFLDGESIGVTSSIPKANVFPHDFVPSQNFVSENKEMLADISGHENFQGLRCTMTKIDKNDNAASNAESMQQINAGKRSRCPNVKEIVRKIKSARTSKPLGITSGHNSTFCGESETATEKISSSFSAKTLQKEAVGSDNSKIEPCEMVSDGSLLNDGLSPQKECQASKLEIQKLNDLKNYDVGSAKLDAASILNDQNLEPKAKDEMDKCIHFRECSKVEEKSTLDEFTWQSCITSTDNLKSTNGQQSCRNELPLNTPSPKNHQQFGMSFSNNTWKKENAQVNEALEKPTLSHADASGHSSVLIDAHTNIVQPRPHKEINVGGGRKFLYEGAPKAVGANNSETVECSSDVLPTLKNHENGDPLIITPAVLNLATEVSEGHLTFQQAVDSLTKPPKKLKVSERLGRKVDKPKIKNRLGNVVPLDDATPLAFNPYSYPYTGARDKQYGQSKFLFPESSSDIPIEIPPAKRNYFQAFSGEPTYSGGTGRMGTAPYSKQNTVIGNLYKNESQCNELRERYTQESRFARTAHNAYYGNRSSTNPRQYK